jgi:tRNA (cmo5U34)-methyltransferase
VSKETNAETSTVDQFFDSLTDQYTGVIERCFPRYREMLWALLDYLPDDCAGPSRASPPVLSSAEGRGQRILELGSGTGNLTVLLAEKYPAATIQMIDISADSLAVCRSRLGDHDRFEYRTEDFRRLQRDDGPFDLVVSSIAVHHLISSEKQKLFREIHALLAPQGIFAYADQFAGATEGLYRRHIENWKAAAMGAGSSPQEWQMWMQHQADHDHHDNLTDQIDWLRAAGFDVIDSPWRYLLWTVIQARKRG